MFASAPMSSLTFRVLLYLWCGSCTSSSARTYVLPSLAVSSFCMKFSEELVSLLVEVVLMLSKMIL